MVKKSFHKDIAVQNFPALLRTTRQKSKEAIKVIIIIGCLSYHGEMFNEFI